MGIKNKKISYLIFLLLLFIFIFSLSSIRGSYYADISIKIDNSGLVDISGETNHPDLIVENSNLFTYKKQSYWLLNITIDDVFSDYIYEIILPEGSTINYIKTSGFNGISEDSGNLIINGFGSNETISFIVQYQINEISSEKNLIDDNIFLILVISIIFLTIILIYTIYKNIGKFSSDKNLDDDYKKYFRGLSSRQKDIMMFLMETKRPITQTEIEKELKIPKAAVSRNVHSLELKGLLEIEKVGMSNLIRLKKQK